MNVQKENIYMNKVKMKNNFQITLDNDFIISDTKQDINRVIRAQGEVLVDEYKSYVDKIEVRGRVRIVILYLSDDDTVIINSIVEELPFFESINIPGVIPQDVVSIKGELEDVTVNIVNSRKISIKVLVNLKSVIDEQIEYEAVIDIENEKIEKCNKELSLTQLVINKKDIFRVKDEIILQSSKKNIKELLYYDVHMARCNTRMADEKIIVKGDVVLFILYLTEDNEYECLEKEITYNGDVELFEARENMIDDIYASIINKEISVKPDDDGENRVIDIDITLNLDIKGYKDEKMGILKDAYATEHKVQLLEEKIEYETLLLKNNTIFRVDDKIQLKDDDKDILQICNSTANVKIDEARIVDNGIAIEGVVEASIIYISNKDRSPLNAIKEMVPFTHIIEVNDINENCVFSIKPYVEQVNIVMLTGNELEIKIVVNVDTIVFSKNEETVIFDINEKEFDKEELDNMSSMVGYIVKEDEDVWSIAKRFYTSVDMLKKTNKIVDNNVKKGDKLLIIKRRH